jgi:hypothetical protein
MFELANVLLGAALSVRFNVLALILATIASVALSICVGLIAGDGWVSILISSQLNVVGLHVGYVVCGVALSIVSKWLIRARRIKTWMPSKLGLARVSQVLIRRKSGMTKR